MEGLRQYVISVIAAALLCGIVIRLTQTSGSREIIRMLCGLFLTIVLLLPLSGKQEVLWDTIFPEIDAQAEAIAAEGTLAAERIKAERIRQRTEAYILNRAEAMDADITASVSLGEDGIPNSVTITGRISPLNRSRLAAAIASELGIPREQQEWIG